MTPSTSLCRRRTRRSSRPPATTASLAAATRSSFGRKEWQGGTDADQNALGVDFPVEQLSGQWISPNAHSTCIVDGQPHHVAVIADPDAAVVNPGGNHSIRGGCLAQKVYSPDKPTHDRLSQPMMRVGGELKPISWELAFDVMAEISNYILEKFGRSAWGMKTYSYQYFENTYAISKLAFETIKTPAYAPHDKPGPGNDTAGIDDAGIVPFQRLVRRLGAGRCDLHLGHRSV